MDKESLVTVIKSTGSVIKNEDEFFGLEGSEFTRVLKFIFNGMEYKILWYFNLMHLYMPLSNIEVIFDSIENSHTWPNRHFVNLQMYRNNDVVCVIPIEE